MHMTPDAPVMPMRLHHSIGYHTIGLFAIGTSALGKSSRLEVKVSRGAPGPHRIIAWKPGEGSVACGMVMACECMCVSTLLLGTEGVKWHLEGGKIIPRGFEM